MQKRIIVIGASGTIGKKVVKRLQEVGHNVVSVSRKSGDYQADISNRKSLETLFKNIGSFDAVAIMKYTGRISAKPING